MGTSRIDSPTVASRKPLTCTADIAAVSIQKGCMSETRKRAECLGIRRDQAARFADELQSACRRCETARKTVHLLDGTIPAEH